MKKLLTKLRTTAARWRTRRFEALGFIPSAELYAMREAYNAMREAYNDELRERLMLKRDYENLYEDYRKALETPARRYGYAITPYVARAQVRKLEDSLLMESAPDEYFKKGLRESLMRAIYEQITYSKQETRDAVIWQARLNVAVVTASPDNVHADPTGDPGTEGPPGAGPLNPLYER